MNIAIVDDLEIDRNEISLYNKTYFRNNYIDLSAAIYEFDSGEAFLANFKKNFYDLIFLDYYFEGLSGLEIARLIRQEDKYVILIFITISRDFAIDSYKVKASGYLVKPIPYNDFAQILSLLEIEKLSNRQFIEITDGYEKLKIILKDIIYCDIKGHYTYIHTKSTGVKKSRMSFYKLVDILKPYKEFLFCYRGCIINMNRVKRMEDLAFFMENEEYIPFRKKEQAKLKEMYTDFLFQKVREGKI